MYHRKSHPRQRPESKASRRQQRIYIIRRSHWHVAGTATILVVMNTTRQRRQQVIPLTKGKEANPTTYQPGAQPHAQGSVEGSKGGDTPIQFGRRRDKRPSQLHSTQPRRNYLVHRHDGSHSKLLDPHTASSQPLHNRHNTAPKTGLFITPTTCTAHRSTAPARTPAGLPGEVGPGAEARHIPHDQSHQSTTVSRNRRLDLLSVRYTRVQGSRKQAPNWKARRPA